MSTLLQLFPSFTATSSRFTDSHCHLDFSAFDTDRNAVLARAEAVGVERFLVPGVSPEQWPRLAVLAAQQPNWQVAYGLHPCFLQDNRDYSTVLATLPEWLSGRGLNSLNTAANKVTFSATHLIDSDRQATISLAEHGNNTTKAAIAVGEIGLDASKPFPELQRFLFQQQLQIAADMNLPVILHHRKTLDEMLKMVRQAGVKSGIVHAFAGSSDQAKAWVDAGFRLGVGGVITYKRARKTRAAIAQMPLEALVLETDSPDMPLCGMQGQRNEPANIAVVAQTLRSLTT